MTSRPGSAGSRSGCTPPARGSRCRSTPSGCARSSTPRTTRVPRSCSRRRAPPGSRPALSWEDVGPAAADARAECYWHDGAVSVTWAMSQAPRGEVRENVLARLIAPHGEIARKRVTLLYRVIDPGEAARIVERDLHNAEFRVNSSARPTARAVVEQQRRARDRAGRSPRRGARELRDVAHRHRPRQSSSAPPRRRWTISRRRLGSACGRCGARRTRRSPPRCRSGCSCPRT